MKRVIKNVVLFMSIAVLSMVFTSTAPDCSRAESGAFFPDPECCSKYYECLDNVAIQHECPAGLFWNNDLKCCDFPWNVNDCYGNEECNEAGSGGLSTYFRRGTIFHFDGVSLSIGYPWQINLGGNFRFIECCIKTCNPMDGCNFSLEDPSCKTHPGRLNCF